ncbi:MAG: hypothetical protein ACM3VZ_01620 [Acidobacteriota bacterium]
MSPTMQSVFQRTGLGQIEVLARRIPLSPLERRLLQMVTGHTRLADLLRLLGETQVPHQALTGLLDAGLIRAVVHRESDAVEAALAPDWVMLFGSAGPGPCGAAGPDVH